MYVMTQGRVLNAFMWTIGCKKKQHFPRLVLQYDGQKTGRRSLNPGHAPFTLVGEGIGAPLYILATKIPIASKKLPQEKFTTLNIN